MRKVRAGEAIKQPSASEWNRIANAVEAIERLNKSKPKQADIDSGIALVKNTTGSTLGQFSIVGLDDAIVTDPQTAASPTNEIEFKQQRHVFNAVAPSLPKHAGKWAVTLDVIEPNAIGRVRIDGVVICKAAWPSVAGASSSAIASRELRRYAEAIGSNTTKLQVGPKGSAQVLWLNDVTADSAAGEGWAIIRIGNSVELPTITRFTLTAALAAAGTADATITSSGADNGDTITVTDWAGNAAESGDKGIAWKVGSAYYVIEIKTPEPEAPEEPLPIVRFTLTANLAAGSTAAATITSSGADNGDTITVTDWSNNGALSGNKGLAVLVGSTYYVIELFDNPEVVRFTLTADLAMARGSTAAANVEVLGAGTTTAETVTNWAKKWAKSGARGHACRVFDGTALRYDVIDVEPLADRVRGLVVYDFETTTATVYLDTLKGLNGDSPTASEIAVKNIHEWAGKENTHARAEWNQADSQWELYQIDCEEGL